MFCMVSTLPLYKTCAQLNIVILPLQNVSYWAGEIIGCNIIEMRLLDGMSAAVVYHMNR